MNIVVLKRDNREEAFDMKKLMGWGEWAASKLNGRVDWQDVVRAVLGRIKQESIRSEDLQQALIDECLSRATWSYYLMAGKLYAVLRHKQVHGERIPTIQENHRLLQSLDLMRYIDYSDEDYATLEKVIDHTYDYSSPHFALKYIDGKYTFQDRIKGKVYETAQFVYMRMAMVVYEKEPRETRLQKVVEIFNHLRNKELSVPTPNFIYLGAKRMGLASCCLYRTADDGMSLATGDFIANIMTQSGAGIGSNIITRSVGEGVRSNTIKHAGKLGYYRANAFSTGANKQSGRSGAGNVNYPIFDPEAEMLSQLRNPRALASTRLRELHYTVQSNPFLDWKIANNEPIMAFSVNSAPDLFEAFYSADLEKFVTLYHQYEADPDFEKKYVDGRGLIYTVLKEAYETGTAYFNDMYEINHHTPFKEGIYNTNLCVAPETQILTDKGYVEIQSVAGTKQNIWNGEEWSEVDVVKTGEDQVLVKVTLASGKSLVCTPYHKWYLHSATSSMYEVRTADLKPGDKLIDYVLPSSDEVLKEEVVAVETLDRTDDTYCFTEHKRHMGIFNGILTGQCVEVAQPTFPYMNPADLFLEEDHGRGEVSLCSLFATNVHKVKDYDTALSVAYHGLRMVDFCIENSDYRLPHVGYTAKQRMNAAGGIMGLASHLASKKLPYTSDEALKETHRVYERHMYTLIKASLMISKERGVAPWIHKTKWVDGWTPMQTYNRNVDKLADFELQYDWDALSEEIKANGGIAHSVLSGHMPGESSSKALGETNSGYPVRKPVIKKTDSTSVVYWAAPEQDNPDYNYELAYDIPIRRQAEFYAVEQKFTDQAISADFYRRINPEVKISSTQIIQDEYLYPKSLGLKSRYYQNSEITDGIDLEDMEAAIEITGSNGCDGGVCTL